MRSIRRIFTRTTRLWLYSIAFAITALLGIYGLLDGQQIAAWNLLTASLFGLAIANVPPQDDTKS